MCIKSRPTDMVRAALFFYTFLQKGGAEMDGYDNDELLLLLDDDLFPIEEKDVD